MSEIIISQLSISPIGKGIDLHNYIKEAINVIKKYNIKFETNDMSTILETENLDILFKIVKEAHEAMIKAGANRVITEIKIDDRRDKNIKLGYKSSMVK